MATLGTFGSVPQSRLPCPSDFDPDPFDDGCEVTEWDLADHIDAAITALQTAQQLDRDLHTYGKVDPAQVLDTFERIQKLMNVAREALEEASL